MVNTFSIPAFTFPFCFATAIYFLGSYNQYYFDEPGLPAPYFPFSSGDPIDSYEKNFVESVIIGVGQVFFAGDVWRLVFILHFLRVVKLFIYFVLYFSGVIIVIAIGICSPIAMFTALAGSTLGFFYGFVTGIARSTIDAGLFGFNPCLTAIFIGGMLFRFNANSILYLGKLAEYSCF